MVAQLTLVLSVVVLEYDLIVVLFDLNSQKLSHEGIVNCMQTYMYPGSFQVFGLTAVSGETELNQFCRKKTTF